MLSDAFAVPANWSVDSTFTQAIFPGGPTTAGYDGTFTVGTTPGFSIASATGALTFPALYINDTAFDQTFGVQLGAHIVGSSSLVDHPTTAPQVDTAKFTSATQPTITHSANVYVRTPNPTITKTVAPTAATAGQTVTYRLRAQNSASRPTAFDTVVTDCVPATLTFGAVQTTPPPVGSYPTSTTEPGCTGTFITWTVGSLVAGADTSLYFTATIDPLAAGAATYDNTANLVAYSLGDPTTDRAQQSLTSTVRLTMPSATILKSVDVATATIGQNRNYTITVTIPANVNFYDAALIDTVPATLSIPAASDFTNVTMTCTYSDSTSCVSDLPGWGTTLPTSGTSHGWWLGDILSKPLVRTVTVKYTGTVLTTAGAAGTQIQNTAAMRWGTSNLLTGPPTNPTNANYNPAAHTSNSSVTVTVTEPGVTVAKKVNGLASDTVAPGEPFTYTVTLTNPTATYASTAYDVVATDAVPTNVLVDPASLVASGGVLTGADPATGGGTITWNLASLGVGPANAVTFTYTATLAASGYLNTSSRTNVATAASWASHPLATTPGFTDGVRRTYPVSPAPAPWADAVVTPDFPNPVITKIPSAGPAYIGESKAFTIVVTNSGTSDALNGKVVDTLPGNWIYDTGSTTLNGTSVADPVISGHDLTWSALTTLAATAHLTIAYTAHPDATATWTGANTGEAVNYTNNATVTVDDVSGAHGNLAGPYTASTSATVHIDRADLLIDKAHDPALDPTAGSSFSWTLTVTNSNTSDPAVGPIVVVDTLPANATYTGFTAPVVGWTDDASVPGKVTFTHAGPLAANSALPIITATATLPADLAPLTDFTNSATVSAKTFDPDVTNNHDSDPASTVIVADVELFKTSVGGPFTAGQKITWHLTATNHGPSVAVAPFILTDTLPSTVDWSKVEATGTGWSCAAVTTGGVLVCTWSTSTLTVGGSTDALTVSATILPSTVGAVDNTATVTHTTPDPVPDNNTDSTTDTVLTSADLSLNKTTVSVDIPANGTGRFRIEVANAGPSDALNVVVHDTLPGGLTFDNALANITSAPGDTWTCVADGGDVTLPLCTMTSNGGTLPLGGSTWFEFDVQADATVTATVLNTATVSSDTPDPNLANNTHDSTTKPVLTIHKSASPSLVARGSKVTYTINVESLSYGATNDVTVTDPIPMDLHVDSMAVAVSSDPSVPGWTDPCVISGVDADGYGGTVTCILNGTLERGRTTPNITIVATVRPTTTPGTLLNVAEVQWTDPQDLVAGVYSEDDSAPVGITLTDRELAATGAMGLPYELAATLIALILGIGMVAIVRRRRSRSPWE